MPPRDTLPPVETTDRETRSAATAVEDRQDRAMEDRAVTESRDVPLDDDARLELFRSQFVQAALPSLPNVDGWHMCWVSTTNDRDTIPLRLSLGYVPVKLEEIAGWRGGSIQSIKSGELAGWVNHNEMVAMKIRQELYLKYMDEAHHAAPAREDMKLIYTADRLKEQSQSQGGDLMVGDGIESIKQSSSVRKADFSHV